MKDIINIEDHADAFDWAYAIWYWLSHNHEGQTSDKYAALSMSDTYNMNNIPDIDFEDTEFSNEEYFNCTEYYHQINEDNWENIYNEFCSYMDNDWDNKE